MKTAIIYASVHHGNTKKVIEAMVTGKDVDLIDATKRIEADLSGYDLIGFASGIYYSRFHNAVLQFAQVNLPQNKDVFFIYTCGAPRMNYLNSIQEAIANKHAQVKGTYFCKGFDTFGPFRLIGGIAKGHPDAEELEDATEFLNGLL